VHIQAVLTSLQEQGPEDVFIELLKDIYINSSMTVNLHKESNKITSGEEYDKEIPYCPRCLQQQLKAYSYD
jgi:hypothetical protein